ncbi:VRR-NUC domain-containing protein [Listeria monocytogenes]|nr:VRR-NUC domain-containing protein [Listeria monocytogenes]EHR7111920.1 VRR-NUC domain-containing protein [Listeria monocytogenes]
MREKEVERKLVKEVKTVGGICPKFVSPGLSGVPDRLVLLPNGKMAFVEVKAPNKKPRLLQVHRMKQLEELGFQCFVLDEVEQIGGVIREIYSS